MTEISAIKVGTLTVGHPVESSDREPAGPGGLLHGPWHVPGPQQARHANAQKADEVHNVHTRARWGRSSSRRNGIRSNGDKAITNFFRITRDPRKGDALFVLP